MRHSFVWLALPAIACTPRGASRQAAEPPRAAPVIEVPAPAADAAAAPAPTGSGDSGTTPDAGAPDASPDVSLDGGASVSIYGTASFSAGDGGLTFDGSVKFGSGWSLAMSPELVVHSALLVPAGSSSARTLLLFARKADCTSRKGHKASMSIDWKRGTKTTFENVSIKKGHGERYKGHIEVLRAPTAPGSTGAIEVDPIPGGNVRGGKVPVHVCR